MKWREVIIGAVVTLLVTVVGGIVVWLLTREPRTEPPTEKLTYTVESVGSLTVDQNKISFVTVRVGNVGDKSAQQVRIAINVSPNAELVEKQITSSAGAASRLHDESENKQGLVISSPILAPSEVITASMLVRGTDISEPKVSVRSAESIGLPGLTAVQPDAPTNKSGLTGPRILSLLAGALAVQAGLLALIRGRLGRYITFAGATPNNTAFALLHQGLTDLAAHILQQELERNGGTTYEFANMALAKHLQNDHEMARRYFATAEWWSRSKHARAVIAFNRAAAAASSEDWTAVRANLAEALKLGRASVLRYCELSIYMKAAAEADAEIRNLIYDGEPKGSAKS